MTVVASFAADADNEDEQVAPTSLVNECLLVAAEPGVASAACGALASALLVGSLTELVLAGWSPAGVDHLERACLALVMKSEDFEEGP